MIIFYYDGYFFEIERDVELFHGDGLLNKEDGEGVFGEDLKDVSGL